MANSLDLKKIAVFVDYWLTGGGKRDGIPTATHDFFVRFGQHEGYLRKYYVMLATCEGAIVGWAVKTKKGVLIHLLVAATFRGMGIGGQMLRRMAPDVVRSKYDQKSGDPAAFYIKHGYERASDVRVGKHVNIELFHRKDCVDLLSCDSQTGGNGQKKAILTNSQDRKAGRQRTIDVLAKRLSL